MNRNHRACPALVKHSSHGPLVKLALILVAATACLPAHSQHGPGLGPMIDKGELTWHIDNRPLREVLQQLSQSLGFALTISEKLPQQKISGEFASVAIDEALTTILSAQNYIIGRSPRREINHIYLFAEGEAPNVAPAASVAGQRRPETEKQKLVADLEALLPPGTLTQTMKDALLAGATAPSESEIAEIRERQSAIFEEFKAQFEPLNKSQTTSGNH